jgi:hypothetical protein
MDEELLDLLAAIRDALQGMDDPRAAAVRAALSIGAAAAG